MTHNHVWLLRDSKISSASMAYQIDFACKECGTTRIELGDIEDADQYDAWKKAYKT
jgi:hypothetical protein